jgi:hypothetical protein
MTRLSSCCAGITLGLGLLGTAFAQSPPPTTDDGLPEDPNNPSTTVEPIDPVDPVDPMDPTHDPYDPTTDRDTDVYIAPQTTTVDIDDADYEDPEDERIGIAVVAGGGASGFTGDVLRGTTDVGGEWGVRVTLGTRSPLAFEGSYIGSAQPIGALGIDDDAVLVGNGVQAALRLNATIDFPAQPFVFGGAAWRRYDLANTDVNTSALSDADNVIEIPLGAGIAGRWQGLMLDLRGEYRFAADEDLLPELLEDDVNTGEFASMDRWGVNASVGYEF